MITNLWLITVWRGLSVYFLKHYSFCIFFFPGVGSQHLRVYPYTKGTYWCGHVCPLLGEFFAIFFIGWNNKGLLLLCLNLIFMTLDTLAIYYSLGQYSDLWFSEQAWAATESGNIEVIHTHKEEHVSFFFLSTATSVNDRSCFIWSIFSSLRVEI